MMNINTQTMVVFIYFAILLAFGLGGSFFNKKKDAGDFFKASHSVGPLLLFLTVFGTTMTAFAMVGSCGEAFSKGIGVYGLMASWSGLIHSAVFFLIGIKLWAFGKKYCYNTQIQFFRARYESDFLGYLLFPILVILVIPYLLIGIIAGGKFLSTNSDGLLSFGGASGLICLIVLIYVFFGGIRGTTWANAMQTLVFIIAGIIAFYMISSKLGGVQAASQAVLEKSPEHLSREKHFGHAEFFSYLFVPLSVGMFPHLFQHWLTAKSAKSFKVSVVMHPISIMLVWAPCVLIGIWASALLGAKTPEALVLPKMIAELNSPVMIGILGAGVLAAIMSSLDSQFMCVGTMFTNDFLFRIKDEKNFTDSQKIWAGRIFIVMIVLVSWVISLFAPKDIFNLAVWCFSGFASLFPVVFAALYWRRATAIGAIASVVVTTIVWTVLFLKAAKNHFEEQLIFGCMPVTVIFLASVLAMVIGSLLTQPPSKETVNKFFPEKK